MFSRENSEFSAKKCSHVFEQPRFIETQKSLIPKIKLSSIDAELSQQLIKREMKLDAADLVGLILKDILNGKETLFDKNMQLKTDKPKT